MFERGLLRLSTGSLLLRYRSDDKFSGSSCRERDFGYGNSSGNQLFHLRTGQRFSRFDTDKTSLSSRAKQYFVRIGKTGTTDEAQPYSTRSCGDGNDGIGRTFIRTITDNEKIVIVVSQFVGGWQAFSQLLPNSANQGLIFWLKLVDKTLELLFRIRRCLRDYLPYSRHQWPLYRFHFRLESASFEFFLPARCFLNRKFRSLRFGCHKQIALAAKCRVFSGVASNQERMAVLLPDLIDGADIGVVEGRSSLSFSLETSQCLGVSGDLVRQELQGNKTIERSVFGLVDHTLPAATELLDNAVVRDGLAQQWRRPAPLRSS
jgi:hypothetical protein